VNDDGDASNAASVLETADTSSGARPEFDAVSVRVDDSPGAVVGNKSEPALKLISPPRAVPLMGTSSGLVSPVCVKVNSPSYSPISEGENVTVTVWVEAGPIVNVEGDEENAPPVVSTLETSRETRPRFCTVRGNDDTVPTPVSGNETSAGDAP
jgi:hypothetical protein